MVGGIHHLGKPPGPFSRQGLIHGTCILGSKFGGQGYRACALTWEFPGKEADLPPQSSPHPKSSTPSPEGQVDESKDSLGSPMTPFVREGRAPQKLFLKPPQGIEVKGKEEGCSTLLQYITSHQRKHTGSRHQAIRTRSPLQAWHNAGLASFN